MSTLPNGREFLFVHKTIDRENNKYLSNIWSGDLSTGKVTQLTRGDKDGSPVVDPEGKSLLFTSRREKDAKGTELYLLQLGGGESRLVKTLKGGFSSISWVDEGNILFTTKASPGENPEKPAEEETGREENLRDRQNPLCFKMDRASPKTGSLNCTL